MILSRLFAECCTVQHKLYLGLANAGAVKLHCLLLLLLIGVTACGPKKPVIPDDVEAIARRCYETLATVERTPELTPAEAMEDGKFLILWSIAEVPDEQGSCIVDSSGTVLLLTSNADKPIEPEENLAE